MIDFYKLKYFFLNVVYSKVSYVETDRARMEPDIYDGPNCDRHRSRWMVSVPKEGDEDMGHTIEFDAKGFPPGTQVIIKEPVCPLCGEIYENCMARDNDYPCSFDWVKWTEHQFS